MSSVIIPDNIKSSRINKGLSQEALAERALINIRTLQRIECGQTVPRGYTLRLIADALEMPLSYFMADDKKAGLTENRNFLQLVTLSSLSFWIFPLANIFVPQILLHFKNDPANGTDAFGKQIIAFQKKWSMVTYGLLILAILLAIIHPNAMDPLLPIYIIPGVGILYIFNSVSIVIKAFQIGSSKDRTGLWIFKRITTLSFICWSLSTVAQADSLPKSFLPPGKLIDIGGWKLHLLEGGDSINGPSVVLEAGAGDFSFDWNLVQHNISEFSRVYSYDRAGSAWSDLGPRPHTMQQAVYELHTLLQKASVPKPYIMVGASYGGLLVRMFEIKYPQEVAGMVLVDAGYEDGVSFINGKMLRPSKDAIGESIPPTKITATEKDNSLAQTPEAKKAIGEALAKAGMPHSYLEAPYDKLPDSIQKIRLWAITKMEYYAANDNNWMLEEKALIINNRKIFPQTLGNKPLVVLTRGRTDKQDTDPEEIERKKVQFELTGLSGNSKQVIAEGSGHHIQMERPDIVVEAIRDVLNAVLSKKHLSNF